MPTVTPSQAGRRLSVAMIVRDEEAVLADSLQSIQDIADEIVIVDTGSNDRTREIARSFGAKVFELPWSDSFSASRNFCARKLQGDFALWLDAGERLDGPSAAELRRFIDGGPPTDKAWLLMVELPPQQEGGYAEQIGRLRLVPQGRHLTFAGRVRESLAPSLAAQGIATEIGPWRIVRGNRDHDLDRKRRKAMRDLRLLDLERQQQADAPALLVALGDVHTDLGRPQEAIAYYRRAIQRAGRGSSVMLQAYYGLLVALEGQEKQQEHQLATCLEALEIFPFDAQLLCAMGGYLQAQGRLDLARRSFATAHEFGQVDPETWHVCKMGEVSATCLSLVLQLLGEEAESRRVLEGHLQRDPQSLPVRRRLLEVLIKLGELEAAQQQVDHLAGDADARAVLRSAVRGAVEAARQNWVPALSYLEAALSAGCRDLLCIRWLAVSYVSTGNLEAALPALEAWQRLEPHNPEVQKYVAALRPLLSGDASPAAEPAHATDGITIDQVTPTPATSDASARSNSPGGGPRIVPNADSPAPAPHVRIDGPDEPSRHEPAAPSPTRPKIVRP